MAASLERGRQRGNSFFELTGKGKCSERKNVEMYLCGSNHIEEHYREVFIPKKKGGRRKLLVPDYLLHTMQKNILRTILSEEKVSKYAKAYCPGRRIRDNAFAHVGAETILELDIKDFFENITYIMVYQCVFRENTIRRQCVHC